MKYQFESSLTEPAQADKSYWFLFAHDQLLLYQKTELEAVPLLLEGDELDISLGDHHFMGYLQGVPCYAASVVVSSLPPKMQMLNLRQAYEILGDELFQLGGRALQIINWYKQHQFCGKCGRKTVLQAHERATACMNCNLFFYPRLSPVIIVLIYRGNELLLVRAPHFKEGIYSAVAGFIEPGETAEQAIAREVQEETGVAVENIQYMGSQPWPFPDSLMLGYFAEYASGDITIDPQEVEDAKWFDIAHLPPLPHRMSIARTLIEQFLRRR